MPILRYDDEPIAIDRQAGDNLDFVTIPAFFAPYFRVDEIAARSVERLGLEDDLDDVPPYTRYPEEDTAVYGGAPIAETVHGIPLMDRTLQPSRMLEHVMDESALERQRNRMSGVPLIEADSNSVGTADMTRRAWKDKTWKEKRRTRLCGIPFWWILLSITIFLFIAAILGGVIGGFVEGRRGS